LSIFLKICNFGIRGDWKPKPIKPWLPDSEIDSKSIYCASKEEMDKRRRNSQDKIFFYV